MSWILLAVAIHVFMSWLCEYSRYRKLKKVELYQGIELENQFYWQTFIVCLLGGWFVAPELWDNSWMNQYLESDNDR